MPDVSTPACVPLARPNHGLKRLILSPTPRGSTARLLTAAVLVPFVLGWLCLQGYAHDLYSHELGICLFAVAVVVVMGISICWNAAILDRTEVERQRAFSDLREATAAAKGANQAKSEFLAHMSHEIRTPLNGVIGMVELLRGTPLNSQQQRYVDLAKSSGEALTKLVDDVLDFSKIEAGRMELDDIDFELHTCIEDVVEVLAQKAATKGLELACYIDPDVPMKVKGDPGRLSQILINLISNAIKFTDCGAIALRVGCEPLKNDRIMLRCTIVDTGMGISQEQMQRLFKPFSQADCSTTRRYGGTGLGLVISKQLAELMGGQIGVESESGRGSTFWFTVGLRKQAESVSRKIIKYIDPAGLRILAVDDNRPSREILRQQIISLGMSADVAGDGEGALQKLTDAVLAKKPFRLVIVDQEMPNMDGIELGKAIKSQSDIKETVLMILLSLESHIDPAVLRAAGFAGHMTKPVRQSELFDAIMNAIASVEGPLPVAASPATVEQPRDVLDAVVKERKGKILLAEDNEINQIVAAEILRGSGYECDIVNDGKQAIEALDRVRYDLVVMDCQMPEMDGFEATRAIREKEGTKPNEARHVPIVALTANAIKGDRERCLDAGMDAYTSKPINPKHLVATIESLLVSTREPEPRLSSISTAPDKAPLQVDALLELCRQDTATVLTILEKFEKELTSTLEQVERLIQSNELEPARRLLHTLKGSAGIVFADELHQTAAEFEQMIRTAQIRRHPECLEQLRIEITRCVGYMPEAKSLVKQSQENLHGGQYAGINCR